MFSALVTMVLSPLWPKTDGKPAMCGFHFCGPDTRICWQRSLRLNFFFRFSLSSFFDIQKYNFSVGDTIVLARSKCSLVILTLNLHGDQVWSRGGGGISEKNIKNIKPGVIS
jgi:hypothetical protein